jgi:hypothetical protein
VSKLLVFRHQRGTDTTKCGLDVLALHCRDHVRGRRIVGGQSVGIEPQPQRIIERHAWLLEGPMPPSTTGGPVTGHLDLFAH